MNLHVGVLVQNVGGTCKAVKQTTSNIIKTDWTPTVCGKLHISQFHSGRNLHKVTWLTLTLCAANSAVNASIGRTYRADYSGYGKLFWLYVPISRL